MLSALLLLLLLFPASAEASPNRCLGAASMVERGCNPHHRRVSPYPSDSLDESWGVGLARNSRFCRGGLRSVSGLSVCRLGAPKPKMTIALIGDSHSAQWRPAMDRTARRLGIAAISLMGSGCDFSTLPRMPFDWFDMSECTEFRERVPGYLADRPYISTAIMAQASYQGPAEKQGYLKAWESLPASITRIVTIVDNPRGPLGTYACLRRAIASGYRPGVSCANPRSQVLKPDYAAQAAGELSGRSGHVLDFSDLFCDRRRCYPVIGGLLVYAQGSHQAPAFNRTLSPYLEDRLKPLL